ncbi:MAG: hypothetical protein ABR587_07920 [Candidatus Binatia bacterium]
MPQTLQTGLPEALPLTGADCFLRAFEAEVRRTAQASHLSQLVLRLGSGFDVEAFRRLIDEVSRANPILRSPIRRRGVVGAPFYRLDRAAAPPGVQIDVHTAVPAHADDGAPPLGPIPEAFFRRLNDRFDARRGKLLRIDVVPRAGAEPGTDIALTWQHMLFDGAGSEFFVEHLAACSADASRDREIPITRAEGGASSPAVAELPAASGMRGRMAQTWHNYMKGLGDKPPASLSGPLRRVRQQLRYEEMRLEGSSGTTAMERAKKMAGFLTPMLFYLAVSLRAHQAVADQRGASPASWVVPLPVNLRPKGSQREVFRTHVSLLWFQVTPEQTRDLGGLIEVLKEQRLAAIRGKLVEAGVAAMDFARYAPARVYSHMARRTFGGELASFFFAYTAEFAAGANSLCGAPILDAFHAPSVPASPGSALVFCLRGGALDVVHVHQQGAIETAELAVMRAALLADLVGA